MAKKKSKDKNEHVVIAFFPDQVAADHAADALKRWDDADDEIKLGAFGKLAMEDGKIKAHVAHKTGRGAGVGAVIGVIAGVLSGGVTLVGGLIAGGAAGGAVGAFMKDSLHMTKEEIEGLTPELSAGKVALVVTCDDFEVGPTQAQLNSLGGTVRNYVVPSATLAAAVTAGLADWPSEPFEPEPTPVPELSAAAMVERTEAVPEFTIAETETPAAPGPTTVAVDALAAEPVRAEVF